MFTVVIVKINQGVRFLWNTPYTLGVVVHNARSTGYTDTLFRTLAAYSEEHYVSVCPSVCLSVCPACRSQSIRKYTAF